MQGQKLAHFKATTAAAVVLSAVWIATWAAFGWSQPYTGPKETLQVDILGKIREEVAKDVALTQPAKTPEPVSTFTRHTASQIYGDLSALETHLYKKSYAKETTSQRIGRLEKSVFGKHQAGGLEPRLIKLKSTLNVGSEIAKAEDKDGPMIEYLERKLFQRSYEDETTDDRLSRLETHVFGRSYRDYPQPLRLKKLTYTIPIMAREVRVSSNDTVVASTNHPLNQPDKVTRLSGTPKANITTQNGQVIVTGNYLDNIYQAPGGAYLRWGVLPVKVAVQNATLKEQTLTADAVARWGKHFSLKLVNNVAEADVIVDWASLPAKAHSPVTRTTMFLDAQKSIRTGVLIQMGRYKTGEESAPVSEATSMRGMLHQLAHALGLWGHSNNPNDVMYPLHPLEQNDIATEWMGRSPRPSALAKTTAAEGDPHPSQRDINTIIQVYGRPGKDLRTYQSQP